MCDDQIISTIDGIQDRPIPTCDIPGLNIIAFEKRSQSCGRIFRRYTFRRIHKRTGLRHNTSPIRQIIDVWIASRSKRQLICGSRSIDAKMPLSLCNSGVNTRGKRQRKIDLIIIEIACVKRGPARKRENRNNICPIRELRERYMERSTIISIAREYSVGDFITICQNASSMGSIWSIVIERGPANNEFESRVL